jgi:hypothetical protein
MQQVPIGTRVSRLGIQRLSVGEGAKCRAILLDPNPRVKYIAYDENLRRRVEVDEEMCIKYALRPSTTFFYLVAKLNTDLNGNVIGDKFTVEYLQLSENLNNDLSDLIAEQGTPKSFSLTKVKKTGEGGKDFSYIKVTPSQQGFEDNKSLHQNLDKLRETPNFIETCWAMIDADTSLNREQYEKLLANPQGAPAIAAPQARPQQQLPGAQAPKNPVGSAMPQAPADFAQQNDFGGGFGDGDDFENM